MRMANWKMWGMKYQLQKITMNFSHRVQFIERESNSKPQECEKTVLTTVSSSVIPNFKGRRSDFGDVVQNFRKWCF